MATIQIREIPEEAYETIRKRARAAGVSIQTYMRDQVIEVATRPTPADLWQSVETILASENTPGATHEQIINDLRELRGDD